MSSAQKRAVSAVTRVLSPLGRVHEEPPPDARADLVLEALGVRYPLGLTWAGEGFPEDVRRALATMWVKPERRSAGTVAIVVARRISPGAQRILDEHAVSWVDETGAARIAAPPGLLVDRHGNDARNEVPAASTWHWSPSAAIVGEVVLTDAVRQHRNRPNERFRLDHAGVLAQRARVSASAVNGALRGWEHEGWIAKSGGARGPSAQRNLTSASDLLSSWAAWVADQRLRELAFHVLFSNALSWVQTELSVLMPPDDSWCIGGLMASELQAPHATAVPRVICHVAESHLEPLGQALTAAGHLRPVTSGARFILRAARWPTIGLAQRRELPLASAPRVYADLLSEGGRSEDVASHFRKVVCGF